MVRRKGHPQVSLHDVVFAVLCTHRILIIHNSIALARGPAVVEHVLLEAFLAGGLALLSVGKVELAGHV